MLMSKTIIFTATLPYEAYKSYKREVDYEYDRYYDEASDEDWGIEPMCTVLKEIIEDEDAVKDLLDILAKDVFQVTCHERLSNFDLVDYVKYIDECDVYLDLEDQVSPSDLEYTIEYK